MWLKEAIAHRRLVVLAVVGYNYKDDAGKMSAPAGCGTINLKFYPGRCEATDIHSEIDYWDQLVSINIDLSIEVIEIAGVHF